MADRGHLQVWPVGPACQILLRTELGVTVLPRWLYENLDISARFGSTYTKIGTIQRRLAWPLRKDDTQIREAFHIFMD